MKLLLENWRKYLNELDAAFHGKGMSPNQMRVDPQCGTPPNDNQWEAGEAGCPQFTNHRGINFEHEDVVEAKQFLDNVQPDHLFAYSRGGAMAIAALNNGASHVPKITFIAPAWNRGWINELDPNINVQGSIIHGTMDQWVPLRQSMELALKSGLPLYIFPNADHGGQILKQKNNPTSGILMTPEMMTKGLRVLPDWGQGEQPGNSDEVKKQHEEIIKIIKEKK
tara:strand:+ start:281 stop:952 length:672 start_codon:yes stop_codon:yes gene_type:complete